MKKQHYGYIRLYRVEDSSEEDVERDLHRLGEFIKHRARVNRDLSYYTVTYVDRSGVDGLVVVIGDDLDRVEREVELIIGFIEASLESIIAKKPIVHRVEKSIPIPKTRNF